MKSKKLYIETYGCQMNVADSEVVASIMETIGYEQTADASEADAVLQIGRASCRERVSSPV